MAVFTDPRPAREAEAAERAKQQSWEQKLGTVLGVLGAVGGGIAGSGGGPMGVIGGAQAGYGLGQTLAGLGGETDVASAQQGAGLQAMWGGLRTGMGAGGKNPTGWTKAWRDHQLAQQRAAAMGKVQQYKANNRPQDPYSGGASDPASMHLLKKGPASGMTSQWSRPQARHAYGVMM